LRRPSATHVAGLALVAAAFACSATRGPKRRERPNATSDAARPAAAAALIATLQAAQRAGFERHDLDAYLRIWAPDATLTAARAEAPSPHDRVLDRAAIEATRRELYFAPAPADASLRWRDVVVAVVGHRARVSWLAVSVAEGEETTVEERYVLRRDGAGAPWRVEHNRFWPRATVDADGQRKVYDAGTWAALDHAAAARRCAGGPCPDALIAAWRFAEAHKAARAWTTALGAGAKGEDAARRWLWRGITAVYAGQVADAAPSFRNALAADPAVVLPPWRSGAAARAGVKGAAAVAGDAPR
jgi:hypothetical protein